MKMSTGCDIWESLFSEWIILKRDYHQGADAKHSHSHLELAWTSVRVYQCRCLFVCAFCDRTHIHAGPNEAPWVLSEMHNREETWQIVGVKGVREVSLAFHCCGLCFWRFQNTKKKLSRLISITTEMTL